MVLTNCKISLTDALESAFAFKSGSSHSSKNFSISILELDDRVTLSSTPIFFRDMLDINFFPYTDLRRDSPKPCGEESELSSTLFLIACLGLPDGLLSASESDIKSPKSALFIV